MMRKMNKLGGTQTENEQKIQSMYKHVLDWYQLINMSFKGFADNLRTKWNKRYVISVQ